MYRDTLRFIYPELDSFSKPVSCSTWSRIIQPITVSESIHISIELSATFLSVIYVILM